MVCCRSAVVLVIMLIVASPLYAADVSGKWVFDVRLDAGSGSPSFTFEQEGEKLTGTYSGVAGQADLSGTVRGDTISFQFETNFGTVKYEGTVENRDRMKGKADYAGQAQGTWTAKRSK